MTHYQTSAEYSGHPASPASWPWFGNRYEFPSSVPDGQPWPSICVVMPSYNQAQYLETAICSVIYQGYPNLEFIIMDGGSTDGSVEIIKKYEPWLLHWQSMPDNGQYCAIQDGFERSSGDIMTWLNSDDILFPWTLRTVGEIFSSLHNVKWLSSSVVANMDAANNHVVFRYRRGLNRRWFFDDRPLSEKGLIQQEGTFWSRKLWEQAGARFDANFPHAGDFELWARFWRYSDLATVSTPLGCFRQHAGQKSAMIQDYLDEAGKVLALYPSYSSYGRIITKLLALLSRYLRHFKPEKNWFQLNCNHPVYDLSQKKWRLERT